MSDSKFNRNGKPPLGLMACKAIMRARISAAAKALGAIVLDHVNWRPGNNYRCDPGQDRLVRLSGYYRSTVQEALNELEDAGFITVHVHGGRSGRNRYEFNWPLIRELDAEMQEALKSGQSPPRYPGMKGPGERAQTRVQTPKKEPVGQARREIGETDVFCRSVDEPTQTRAEAASQAAVRNWNTDLRELFVKDPDTYAEIIDRMDDELQEAATAAEMKRRGAGASLVIELLQLREPAKRRGQP